MEITVTHSNSVLRLVDKSFWSSKRNPSLDLLVSIDRIGEKVI